MPHLSTQAIWEIFFFTFSKQIKKQTKQTKTEKQEIVAAFTHGKMRLGKKTGDSVNSELFSIRLGWKACNQYVATLTVSTGYLKLYAC